MKIASWNVAGFRACAKKGLNAFITVEDADIYCFQEVKAKADQLEWKHPGFHVYLNAAEKAGYSGTLTATWPEPIAVTSELPDMDFQGEGRVITCEYDNFYLVNCYTPNSQELLKRLSYRMRWETCLRETLRRLDQVKPVIYCGDLNVCHQPIDIYSPATHEYSPGYSQQERDAFSKLLDLGFVDVWRTLHPDTVAYTYWSYRGNARENNHGWRLDYFVVSKRLLPCVRSCITMPDVDGSDHCPIMLDIRL